MKNLFNQIFSKIAYNSGIDLILKKVLKKNEIIVLSFHRITNDRDEFWPATTPQTFREIVAYCATNFNVVSFSELNKLQFYNPNKPTLIFSFDDGYKDFVQYALPILQEFKLPANHNIVTDCADGNRIIWTQKLNILFKHLKQINYRGTLSCSGNDIRFSGKKADFIQKYMDTFYTMLNNHIDRDLLIEDWASEVNCKIVMPEMMNWKDIKYCANNNIEIGSHTKTHTVFSDSTDVNDKMLELYKSKSSIEMITEKPCEVFAFPNGKFKEDDIDLVTSAGYKYILTVDESYYIHNPLVSSHLVPRINIPGESFAASVMRMFLFQKKMKNFIQ